MMVTIEAFHFMRPALLLLVPVLVAIWLWSRPTQTTALASKLPIPKHLSHALQTGQGPRLRFYAMDWAALVAILLAIGASGPTWSRQSNPLVAETAPLVTAIQVTPSMDSADVSPTRIERARLKIADLIGNRGGARTGLVAYAGSAHQVSPLTEDPNILRPLLEGLIPEVMPVDGSDINLALDLAANILGKSDTPGAVLVVTDSLPPPSSARDDLAIICLFVVPYNSLSGDASNVCNQGSYYVSLGDDSDIESIADTLRAIHAAALIEDERLDWRDSAGVLAWPAMLLVLLWFRRGWTVRWGAIVLAMMMVMPSNAARAEGWRDWFATPDQQGYIAFLQKDYGRAGELFVDPYRKAYAMMKNGQYAEAAAIFASLPTAEAAFAEGVSQMRSRQYRPAIASFEKALERRPDYPEAQANLELAKVTLEYVEETREASDTGEDSGIGADDTVYDNEAERGADTQRAAEPRESRPMTTDQWLATIDTDMSSFLRNRFLIDLQGTDQ